MVQNHLNPLAHWPTQIILIYVDGVEISTMVLIENHAQKMAVATYIANEVLTSSPIGLLSYVIVEASL
jgi:hypothetical protein